MIEHRPGVAADALLAAAAVEIAIRAPGRPGRRGRGCAAADSPSRAPLTSAALPGLGAEGTWQRHAGCWSATAACCANCGDLAGRRSLPPTPRLAAEGRGAVHVVVDGTAVATLGIADRPREIGPDVVRAAAGRRACATSRCSPAIQPDAARAVAAAAGVDDVRAGLLPADKLAAVADLRAAHGAVAMVGDGVNDAPALASADVGIAMGAIGSAAALESADIALMSDELEKIPYVLRLSRATLANIRTNVALSIGLKVAVLALAIGGAVDAVDGGAGRHRRIGARRRKRYAFAPTQ